MRSDLKPKLPSRLTELLTTAAALSPAGAPIPSVQYLSGDSRTKIYDALASGQLLAIKRGRGTLVTWESLTEYLASRPPAVFGTPDSAKQKNLRSADPGQSNPQLERTSDVGGRSDV